MLQIHLFYSNRCMSFALDWGLSSRKRLHQFTWSPLTVSRVPMPLLARHTALLLDSAWCNSSSSRQHPSGHPHSNPMPCRGSSHWGQSMKDCKGQPTFFRRHPGHAMYNRCDTDCSMPPTWEAWPFPNPPSLERERGAQCSAYKNRQTQGELLPDRLF